jgi:hypothetical protein
MEVAMNTVVAGADVSAYMKWKLVGPAAGSLLTTGMKVAIHGGWIDRYLQYEHQRLGINLGWTDNASAQTAKASEQWQFVAAGTVQIKYGDVLALKNHKAGSYVVNGHRTVGVDLDWTKEAVKQWMIIGGQEGKEVAVGDKVSLFNTKCKLPLICFDRSVGGDLGWPDSKTWGEVAKGKAFEYIKRKVF